MAWSGKNILIVFKLFNEEFVVFCQNFKLKDVISNDTFLIVYLFENNYGLIKIIKT